MDIHLGIRHVRKMIRLWDDPVVEHYSETPFMVLISCLLSLRTQDKTTDAASDRLFRLARTPQQMQHLSPAALRKAIYPVSFYRVKAQRILQICRRLIDAYGGRVPNKIDALLTLPGVGRKTANLVLTLGFDRDGICVDTHVHRIFNRWNYVHTRWPDDTEMQLRQKLPKQYWKSINKWLVTFGQHHCKPISPLCSRCSLEPHCPKNGVTYSR